MWELSNLPNRKTEKVRDCNLRVSAGAGLYISGLTREHMWQSSSPFGIWSRMRFSDEGMASKLLYLLGL